MPTFASASAAAGAEPEPHVFRASCLAALGELCELLRFAVHPFLQQMLSQVAGVICMEGGGSAGSGGVRASASHRLAVARGVAEAQGAGTEADSREEKALVRRAAVLVVERLVKGLGAEAFGAFPEELRRMRDVLEHAVASDPDQIVRAHAASGLMRIEESMRGALLGVGGRSTARPRIEVL